MAWVVEVGERGDVCGFGVFPPPFWSRTPLSFLARLFYFLFFSLLIEKEKEKAEAQGPMWGSPGAPQVLTSPTEPASVLRERPKGNFSASYTVRNPTCPGDPLSVQSRPLLPGRTPTFCPNSGQPAIHPHGTRGTGTPMYTHKHLAGLLSGDQPSGFLWPPLTFPLSLATLSPPLGTTGATVPPKTPLSLSLCLGHSRPA